MNFYEILKVAKNCSKASDFYTTLYAQKFSGGDKLPSEYQEVEYIENIGTTQYIDTGWKRDYAKDIEVEAIIKPSTFDKRYCILTDYNYISDEHMSFEINNSNYARFYVNGSNDLVGTTKYNYDAFNTVKYCYNCSTIYGTVGINGNDDTKAFTDIESDVALYSARIFIDIPERYSTFKFSFKLKRMIIKENGICIRNFIPCYRKSDNEVGLYDIADNVFYTNQGTGSFTAGPDVQV